jgi:hypothetical protein
MGKELIKGRESETRYRTAQIRAQIIQQELDDIYDVLLFGSVSRAEARPNSDIDIAVIPNTEIKKWKLSILREKLEELTIPYTIDLVDFSNVSERFKKIALSEALWWRK